MNVETPMINIKNGNTRSVGVKPCHDACLNGAYIELHDPGLFTMIMPAIVMPRKMSSESRRLLDCFIEIVFILLLIMR